jgi:hypothetical protein
MKKYILIILLVISSNNFLNSQNWNKIQDTTFSFEFPNLFQKYDTLNTKFYSCQVDSLLALQVHVFKNAKLNFSNEVMSQMLRKSENDSLKMIAKLFALATNSEIVEYHEVMTDNVKGIQIGLAYKTLASNIPYLTFVRYYFYKGKFYSFTITGSSFETERIIAYKSQFFKTLKFF